MSHLVLHLLANEGAQFVGNHKGAAIAGGLALVEETKIPKFQDSRLNASELESIQDEPSGKSDYGLLYLCE